jgi:hypothetical protein
MHPSHPAALLATLAVAALAAAPLTARAVTHTYSAVGICEAPLPVYDAQLRKRPTGIRNESGSPVFISCSIPAIYASSDRDLAMNIQSAGAAASVTCTLAAGNANTVSYRTATVDVGAGSYNYLYFSDIFLPSTLGSYNFSCKLPAHYELNFIWITE